MIGSILIVDDSRFARTTLRQMLARRLPGCLLSEADCGQVALEMVKKSTPDLILLDFNMPGDDGLLVAGKIRESHPGIRIILITANVQDRIVRQAAEMGIGFLPKPVDETDFLSLVQGG